MRVSGRTWKAWSWTGCSQLARVCLLTVTSRHVPGRPGECMFESVLKCHKSRVDLE